VADVDLVADMDEVSANSIGTDNTEKERNDGDYVDGSAEDDITDDASKEKEPKSNKKKRPLSLAGNRKKTKVHSAVELLTNLSSAVEKAASQKADAKALEMEVKVKELAASNSRAEAEAKLKSRELDMMEKKMDLETKKAAVELNILMLQEKEQLLLTRKRLIDAGVAISEVDAILPIEK